MSAKKTFSYIKKPWSGEGWVSFALALAAAVGTQVVIYMAVRSAGEISSTVAAAGCCMMILDVTALIFTMLSLREKEKNVLPALIGGAAALIVLIEWACVFAAPA